MKHGGKREGAGRPPVNGKMVRKNIYLRQDQVDRLTQVTDNVSAKIRELIDMFLEGKSCE